MTNSCSFITTRMSDDRSLRSKSYKIFKKIFQNIFLARIYPDFYRFWTRFFSDFERSDHEYLGLMFISKSFFSSFCQAPLGHFPKRQRFLYLFHKRSVFYFPIQQPGTNKPQTWIASSLNPDLWGSSRRWSARNLSSRWQYRRPISL